MAYVVTLEKLYTVHDDDLLSNQDISVESLFGKILDGFKTVWFNLKNIDKDYIQSGLKEYQTKHRKDIEDYLRDGSFKDNEIFAVPDGLNTSYSMFSSSLDKLFKEIPFEQTLKGIENNLRLIEKAHREAKRKSDSSLIWELKSGLGPSLKELDDFNSCVKQVLKTQLNNSHSRPRRAKDLFRNKEELGDCLKTVESFDKYQLILLKKQNDLKRINNKIKNLVSSLSNDKTLSKACKEIISDYIVKTGLFVEFYGVLVHESIRLGHNLVVSLKKNVS